MLHIYIAGRSIKQRAMNERRHFVQSKDEQQQKE